ncbi:hypothetical protein [Salinisphaera sp. T31B1]|uniref:hypothetical protein n=1 Tax=Salinisphaera sp. T31B1 TaxID=727963 RepID=UPI0033410C64
MRKHSQWLLVCASCALASLASTGAFAQALDDTIGREAAQPPTVSSLIAAWMAFPELDQVVWPYSYIRVAEDDERARQVRSDLGQELSTLAARLDAYGGRQPLRSTVKAWQKRLGTLSATRVPGDWSPASLMTRPYQRPPVSAITALGACRAPDWVEVWDANGIHRTDWRGGLTLSDLLTDRSLRSGSAGRVAIVDPYGQIIHRGVQAWNFADAPLAPGSRVIASLPLNGEAFPWIRDAIARVLAHAPPADDCREVQILATGGSHE